MKREAHESLQSVHRHWTIMSKAHFTSPKVRNQAYRKKALSELFWWSSELANQGMSQFQGSQGAILEFNPAGHMCCGFSPFFTRPLQLKLAPALSHVFGIRVILLQHALPGSVRRAESQREAP